MVIIPKSLSLVPEFCTYITNCVLDRVTWMPPQHHMLHILYIQHGIHHLYLLSCFALNSLSWFAASPSAQLPSQEPGLFNIRLSPELHLQISHHFWSLCFKDTPFCHCWCHSVSWASLYIVLGLWQGSPTCSPCLHALHPMSHITLNVPLQGSASKMWVTLWASILNRTELKLFHVTSKYLNDVTWAHHPPQGLPLLFLWHGCLATCSYPHLALLIPSPPPLRPPLQHPASSLLHHLFGSISSLTCPLSWLTTLLCGHKGINLSSQDWVYK